MHLAYFDENKYTEENPYFYVGGILIPDTRAKALEARLVEMQHTFFQSTVLADDLEFHGKDMFQGKGAYRKRPLQERIALFRAIGDFLIEHAIPVRLVRIDANHRDATYPESMGMYRWGLTLMLERFCDYLDIIDDIGIVFADYEKDEITGSIRDISRFMRNGTPTESGRTLDRLLDTVYFTQSHHSRFLQVADVIVYMAQRYETAPCNTEKWHDQQVRQVWEKIKANVDYHIQHWPENSERPISKKNTR